MLFVWIAFSIFPLVPPIGGRILPEMIIAKAWRLSESRERDAESPLFSSCAITLATLGSQPQAVSAA